MAATYSETQYENYPRPMSADYEEPYEYGGQSELVRDSKRGYVVAMVSECSESSSVGATRNLLVGPHRIYRGKRRLSSIPHG